LTTRLGGVRPCFNLPATSPVDADGRFKATTGTQQGTREKDMKKRIALAAATSVAILGWAGVAAAFVVGPPEIDAAAANIAAKPSTHWTSVACTGANGDPYITYRGNWAGSEIAVSPPVNPYPLTGAWKASNIVWTVDQRTGRGVLEGIATLQSAPATGGPGITTYSGPMVLVTQGILDSAGNGVQARGWINGRTYTNSALDGGSLLANVEFVITPTLVTNGEFGQTMGFSDLSATYNNKIC
jgi:hypothetical protein